MIVAGSCFLAVGLCTIFLSGISILCFGIDLLAIEILVAGVTMTSCGIGFFVRGEDPDLQRERKEKCP